MGANLENCSHINFSYIWLSNDSTYNSLPGNTSSCNTFDDGSENHSFITIQNAIRIATLVICILGAVGNGMAIWLLGFRIKRNHFSTYILNLAVADFGVLISVSFVVVILWLTLDYFNIFLLVFYFLFLLMYSFSQFLLTAISVDRCVAVFFPLWYRCRKPPRLSTIVCALIGFLSVLLSTGTYILTSLHLDTKKYDEYYHFFVNALLGFPVMTIATVSLFVKVCMKAQQSQRGKHLTIILLTLLFALPFNLIFILYVSDYLSGDPSDGALLFACLNSSVNPAIYILVGRQWKSRQRENMRMIFQKVFKEEEGLTEETPVETQL